ncbi:MAG: toprim domain-containing protein [Planctomycetota bacterium]
MRDLNRRSELDAFKRINLSLIAAEHGYEVDRRKSTRHSVLMRSGGDKILIAQNGDHYIYCSVDDPASSGTVIDFAQRVIEPGCSLGRVRQLLRPFLSGGYVAELSQRRAGRFATAIKPSETDLLAVAARYASFVPIAPSHPYLCGERGITAELLQGVRLRGRIACCPRHGGVIFPHWGQSPGGGDRCLVGYEIKGPGVNRFSKGGRKGLWISNGLPGDRVLAFAESGLDAVSYLAVRGGVRVASLSGRMNPQQPELVLSAIRRMGEGAQIVAAFDNDEAGDQLTDELARLVDGAGRPDLLFREERPAERGADWNQVLMQTQRRSVTRVFNGPQPGR